MPRWMIWASCVALLTLVSCTKPAEPGANTDSAAKESAPSNAADKEIIIPVEAAFPSRCDISSHFETTTRVLSERRVEVVAEGVGECIQINVEEGKQVNKGDVLVELKKDDAISAMRQLEIQVAQTSTQYNLAEASLAEGLGAKVERDNAKFAYEQAKANLETQKLHVEKLTVRAPIDGIVTRKNVQLGQIVTSAMPIFSIVDPASYILEINPPERDLTRLSVGQVAKVTIDAVAGQEFEAHVRRINPAVDPLTGTVKVVLDFAQEAHEFLRDSAFARVRLVMDTHPNALVVIKEALMEENGRKYLYIIEEDTGKPAETETAPNAGSDNNDNSDEAAPANPPETVSASPNPPTGTPQEPVYRVKRVEVETGFEDSTQIEILSGIDDHTQIVTLGQDLLKSGARVKITNADAELAKKANLPAAEALEAAKAERAKLAGKETPTPEASASDSNAKK